MFESRFDSLSFSVGLVHRLCRLRAITSGRSLIGNPIRPISQKGPAEIRIADWVVWVLDGSGKAFCECIWTANTCSPWVYCYQNKMTNKNIHNISRTRTITYSTNHWTDSAIHRCVAFILCVLGSNRSECRVLCRALWHFMSIKGMIGQSTHENAEMK